MGIDVWGMDTLVRAARRARASDVHLTAGEPVRARVDGALTPLAGFDEAMDAGWLDAELRSVMTPAEWISFVSFGEVDLAREVEGVGRFRLNAYRRSGRTAAALRLVPMHAASLFDLGLPPVAAELAMKPRGLVLVTGPTGSGKSATLAGMVTEISRRRAAHIVTIEDPVEFVFADGKALIHQREVGTDTLSFPEAIRRALRQDPDVIVLGELRDRESIAAALTAAETGHLVLATLHTQGAAKTMTRIVDSFPPDRRDPILAQLSSTLQGVVSQALLPRASGPGRVVATEVLLQTPAVAHLVRSGEIAQLPTAMQAGSAIGMHTMDQDLRRLVESGQVTPTAARRHLVDAGALDALLVDAHAA